MITQVGYQDEKATPQVSPLSVTGAAVFALQVPVWANRLAIKGTVSWKHGDGDLGGSGSGNGYCTASASAWQDFPVVAGGMFRGLTSASCTFEFYFYKES